MLKLQGPLHLQADAWVDDQDLILELFEPKRCQPLQLPQKMKGDGLFGTTGAVFHLDGNPKPLPDAAQTLDPLSSTFGQHLAVAAAHQLRIESTVTCNQIRMGQHRPADLLQFRMA